MTILCLDTSTEVLRLGVSGSFGWCEELLDTGLKHGENLFSLLESLLLRAGLKPEDIELIVCSRGPGSFTGLRIGMAAAKGLAEGLSCPLVSLSCLEIMARFYPFFPGLVVPVIDAKKQRFYTAGFSAGLYQTKELDATPEEIYGLCRNQASVLFTGPGAGLLKNVPLFGDPQKYIFDPCPPQSYCLMMSQMGFAKYGKSGPESPEAGPVYLRPSEAELNRK